MERRDVLRFLVSAAGVAGVRGLAPEELLALGRSVHVDAEAVGLQDLKALDPHANRTVIAAAERILPASDTPGATDAGVNRFIDHMLADWYPPAERDRFLNGLRALDETSRSRYRRDFVACAEADQMALLTAFDQEETADHWFAILKYLTVWGWFTSEPVMRSLGTYPPPGRYDGCAPYRPRTRAARSS